MSNEPKKEYPAEKLLRFSMGVKVVTSSQNIFFSEFTNGFTVRNTGTTLVSAGGILLSPGESFAIGGNRGEVFDGRLDLRFEVQSPAPATITNEALITEKVYTNITS